MSDTPTPEDQEMGAAGAVLANETLRCGCGSEVRLTGTWRVMRGTNIRCANCGHPLLVYGPTVNDIETQREEAMKMLRRFVSPKEVLRAILHGRCEEVVALLARLSTAKRKTYSLTVHRAG